MQVLKNDICVAHDNDNDRYEPNSDFCGPGDAKVVLHKKKNQKKERESQITQGDDIKFQFSGLSS